MDGFGIVGMMFGGTAFVFAMTCFALITGLRKEFEDLKKSLKDSGALEKGHAGAK